MNIFYKALVFLMILSLQSCNKKENSEECDQSMAGVYIGEQVCTAGISTTSTITITITGSNGDYTITSDPNSSLLEDELEQNECGFSYRLGPIGNRSEGELTVDGDVLKYSATQDSFGAVPCEFEGVRQ